MKFNDIASLLEALSERDLAILQSLRTHRVLTTALIRRLHFPISSEPTKRAAGEAMRPRWPPPWQRSAY